MIPMYVNDRHFAEYWDKLLPEERDHCVATHIFGWQDLEKDEASGAWRGRTPDGTVEIVPAYTDWTGFPLVFAECKRRAYAFEIGVGTSLLGIYSVSIRIVDQKTCYGLMSVGNMNTTVPMVFAQVAVSLTCALAAKKP
jgi:hypothetical protein